MKESIWILFQNPLKFIPQHSVDNKYSWCEADDRALFLTYNGKDKNALKLHQGDNEFNPDPISLILYISQKYL